MLTARDIMTPNPGFIRTSESVHDAAVRMAEFGVGALPICGEDDRLKGMITDRDIVLKVVAAGKEPRALHAGELVQDELVAISADDEIPDLLHTMAAHRVRRLPIIDGHRLVGMVTLADVARALEDPEVGLVVQAITDRP